MPYPTTTPPQPFSCVALQHVCYLQGTLTCPTPPHPTSKMTTLVGAASQPPTQKNFFREILLPAAARRKTASKKAAPGRKRPWL